MDFTHVPKPNIKPTRNTGKSHSFPLFHHFPALSAQFIANLLHNPLILYNMTTHKLESSSPHTPLQKTHHSILINCVQTQQSVYRPDRILDLYSKFVTLNSQVSIDHDLSAFNMIDYGTKDLKMEFDKELVVAKLKRLENNAELKRINMELEHRKKKLHRHHKESQLQVLPENEKYMNTYREFTEQRSQHFLENDNHTDSEEEAHHHEEMERPQGITFFDELKRHPKVLEYTVQQIRSKEMLRKEQANSRQTKLLQFRRDMGHVSAFKMRKEKAQKDTHNSAPGGSTPTNPQRLAQNIFRRLYTKKNKERPMEEVKKDKRMSQFVSRQEMIVDNIDQRSLSKELHKKLKERLNNIATELYLDEKRHAALTALPSVRLNKTLLI